MCWGKVRIGAGKGGGDTSKFEMAMDTSKIEMAILFSHRHLVGENSGYYKVK